MENHHIDLEKQQPSNKQASFDRPHFFKHDFQALQFW